MNSLAIGIGVTLCAFIALIWRHHLRCLNQGVIHIAKQSNACDSEVITPSLDIKIPVLLSIVLLFSSVSLYSQLGHFSDWDKGNVDEHIDYLITADINKNAKTVNEQPNNEIALLNLAQSYADGGLYSDSVKTFDELLQLTGDDAGILGMKANAMYYRDNRAMSLDIDLVIARALAIDEYEFQSRLLLATHGYLNGNDEEAIKQWELLLKSDSQSFNRDSINNAILRAEQKIANRSVTASE
ncbi:nitrite reductase [Shewanella canadensis]|uniref:Nitrite reductase n=1 Tax=Shewanella canadensis TaxID=271096 RepID=A0A3S0J918_9GAMM|nr:nitrite reductase [Shewanella canadensis]RTR40419.1 nitrite reductase [Shewanella canadensis]